MATDNNACFIPLISGEGVFDVSAMDTFSKKIKLGQHGLSYSVVSTIGPQNSGKSTLSNHLFGTNFRERDSRSGTAQTTRGIWLAKVDNIKRCTLIFDVEGTDGVEKNGDNTFEMQSALFALTMTDILIVNLGIKDVGRCSGGCVRLLEAVFEVMMQLGSPRRTTLLFVIRDQDEDETSLEQLTEQLHQYIQQAYDSVPKPDAYSQTELSYFFDVHVTALPHFRYRRNIFDREVVSLRTRFFNDYMPAGGEQARVPASGIAFSAHAIWQQIKENKDIDLHSNRIMVATVRCNKIREDKSNEFEESQGWIEVKEAVKETLVEDFGEHVTSFIDVCLEKYDAEASDYDESVRTEERIKLKNKLLEIVQPAYQSMLNHLHSRAIHGFWGDLGEPRDEGQNHEVAVRCFRDRYTSQFDEGCTEASIEQAMWDPSEVREKLQKDMSTAAAAIQAEAVGRAQLDAANEAASIAWDSVDRAQLAEADANAQVAEAQETLEALVAAARQAEAAAAAQNGARVQRVLGTLIEKVGPLAAVAAKAGAEYLIRKPQAAAPIGTVVSGMQAMLQSGNRIPVARMGNPTVAAGIAVAALADMVGKKPS